MGKLKTTEELLHDLKKANKIRKEYLANRAGFQSVEDYKKHLETPAPEAYVTGMSDVFKKGKETVHIVNILDLSSSMGDQGKISRALEGLNSEVKNLSKNTDADYFYSLTTFSYRHLIEKKFDRTPIQSVGNINASAHGMTALNDAVGLTLSDLKSKSKNERVVVSIFTDGEENASQRFSNTDISRLVEECQALGMVITFIGTEKDTKDVIKNYKIHASNTLSHDNTSRGVSASFDSKFGATMNFMAEVSRGVAQEELTTGFYSKKTGKL